jgi:hypothetical protein
MLLHKKEMLTIAKSKLSRLLCSKVVILPLESILSKYLEMMQNCQVLWFYFEPYLCPKYFFIILTASPDHDLNEVDYSDIFC